MGATTGSFGQPNYLPTQGTGQNPSVSIGFGMESPEFQEGLQTTSIDEFGNPMTTQSLPGYQLNTNPVFPGNQQQPTYQPTQATQQNPSVSIGMPGGSFGGGKSGPMPAPQPAPIQSAGNPNTVPLMGGMGSFTNVPAPGQNPSVSMGMPIQQPNRFIPPMAPGAGARRPTPGFQFPGQTGLTRPRVAPQPAPINRFTRGRFR